MYVTPHAGVWIEIQYAASVASSLKVTPHAGVWIEMLVIDIPEEQQIEVTPHAGVWIEIIHFTRLAAPVRCHTPRGCVD